MSESFIQAEDSAIAKICGPQDVVIEPAFKPHTGRNEVLITPSSIALSDRDIEAYLEGNHNKLSGLNFSGYISEVGSDVSDQRQYRKNRRVLSKPIVHFYKKRTKNARDTREIRKMGIKRVPSPGLTTDFTMDPGDLFTLPSEDLGIPGEFMSFFRPFFIAWRAIEAVGIAQLQDTRKSIFIIGDNEISFFLLKALHHLDPPLPHPYEKNYRIVMYGSVESQGQHKFASDHGAIYFSPAMSPEILQQTALSFGGADIVFDTLGTQEYFDIGLRLLNKRGTYMDVSLLNERIRGVLWEPDMEAIPTPFGHSSLALFKDWAQKEQQKGREQKGFYKIFHATRIAEAFQAQVLNRMEDDEPLKVVVSPAAKFN